ncbi:hypothetical protein IVB14_15845 [Bradyrhizobium sp. 180]|uniref:hypothetical protein n=1 Tax=unclassified Bradyrhizobium TaxID=2631580 RepID=UPI001FFB04FF|nr:MULTISPECIES: hypothetical protein [unclassified Bradyrhizobium]MCK1425250.1 hypothetical protein [Bradyrhizobium sp. CW12]MCK1491858.1 hypothetical protein [Bradyrhizobium sp. 180]MCK1530283.1 hypothetical protein [Bradyrhizobium sp. 182]MCK1596785.1 hypothetical protein [Bradyrhizobium sp. 164]MCK1619785.1 hypothetical protein [Bradyrhizobium sp. 159]
MERGSFDARHDFDALPLSPDVDVRCAQSSEIAALSEMAHRLVPGVRIEAAELSKYLTFDPQSILTFSRKGLLLGGMAFLFLNDRGHDALLLDEICLTAPETRHLASAKDDVAAIYIWAIAATGRGIAGLGKAAAHLRQLRFRGADCYAQPSTVAGRDIMRATGFAPVPSFQPDLWCYERPWHRRPMPGAIIQARSFADARY